MWRLKLEVEWNKITNYLIECLLLIALSGIYRHSCFLGPDVIFVTHNPAFGGRGPGFTRRATNAKANPHSVYDRTKGFPGEG